MSTKELPLKIKRILKDKDSEVAMYRDRNKNLRKQLRAIEKKYELTMESIGSYQNEIKTLKRDVKYLSKHYTKMKKALNSTKKEADYIDYLQRELFKFERLHEKLQEDFDLSTSLLKKQWNQV